jgi:non-specific serine/threonine protein kinase
LNPNAPRALDAVVSSMLARQPADRMAGVPILLRELERLEEGLGLASGPNAPIGEPAPGAPERPEPALRPIDHEAFARHRAMMERESRRRPAGSRTGLLAALGLLLAALGIGFGSYMYYASGPGARQVATAHPQEAPAAPGPTAPPPVAEAGKEPVAAFSPWKEAPPRVADNPPTEQPQVTARAAVRPIAPAPIAKAITEPAPAPVSERESPGMLFGLSPKPILADPAPLAKTADLIEPEPAAPEPAPKSPRPVKAAAKAPAPQPAGTAQLILAVSPGGELYIDGERRGATPQVTTFDLEPGMHRIEVRSGSRKPFLTYMTLAAGDVRRIRHDFDAKPSRPPG